MGPGLWVTHRRPGRYIAAMAPGLALRDGHRNERSRGDKEGGEGRSIAKGPWLLLLFGWFVWRSEDSFRESVLSSSYVGPRVKLGL